jgi:2-dehydropantoate 2-reductase
MMSRLAIVGVGAIGGSVAADLADLKRDELLLCTRTPFDSLVVEHPQGRTEVRGRLVASPSDAMPVDWVLLTTKAHQSAAAGPWLDALCGAETVVAVLQNGVDHTARITPLVRPATPVLPVVVQLPAEKIAAGHVVQSRNGLLFVPDDTHGRRFATLFDGARTSVRPTADFVSQAWWKLISNAALGGVCALAQRENAIARDPAVRELVIRLMREVVLVGRAEGASLPDDAPEKVLDRVLEAAADHWSSISVDRREGRTMEWEVRNAVVGRLGRIHGVATPWNDAITAMLRAASGGSAGTDAATQSSARRPAPSAAETG